MASVRSVRVPDHVLTRRVESDLVALNLENEEYYGLDDVGTAIWEALVASTTVDAAVAKLLEEFEVDEDTLRRDVDHLIEELSARGLLAVDPP